MDNQKGGALKIRAFICMLACMLFAVGFVQFALQPTTAQAMTTDKATARSNEDGGSSIIGGIATRLTWEGTVGDGESVTEITLTLPEGGTFDGSTTRVTILDGLTRIPVDATPEVDGNTIAITFGEAIPSGSLVRLEISNMVFPKEAGDYTVTGTYISDGQVYALPESPAITIVELTPLQSFVNWLDGQAWVQAWNSNQFLGMFFKPQLLVTSFVTLAQGWFVCLAIVLIAYPIAIILGLAFAFMKMSKHRLVRAVAVTYINILRGTPLFLQIYIMFFGLPMLGINIADNVLGVIVMAINSSAYLSEIFRSGIQSIPAGQYEAASSLGMNSRQTMFWIILPQTIRRVLPTVTSDFITSYKDTSLLSSVGVMELMMFSKNLTTVTGNITPYIAAAIYYLIVTLPLIKIVSIVERNIARSESGSGPRPKGKATSGEPEVKAPTSLQGVHCEGVAPEKDVETVDPAPSALSQLLAPFKPAMAKE
jgi:polar amino acid transport system substrate-binding protein